MEDNECFLKYIEIVPVDNFNNCSDITDIKQEPDMVKVYVACIFTLVFVFYCLCGEISWSHNMMWTLISA